MIRLQVIISALLVFVSVNLFAQDSTTTPSDNPLIKVWTIEEFIENGKKFADENMLEIVVDFREDGQYTYWEENESTDGIWEMSDDGTTIYFDKDTPDEMVWEIISLEPSKLEVKLTYEKSRYRYTFIPKVKKVTEE
jgi:hypothetical protein